MNLPGSRQLQENLTALGVWDSVFQVPPGPGTWFPCILGSSHRQQCLKDPCLMCRKNTGQRTRLLGDWKQGLSSLLWVSVSSCTKLGCSPRFRLFARVTGGSNHVPKRVPVFHLSLSSLHYLLVTWVGCKNPIWLCTFWRERSLWPWSQAEKCIWSHSLLHNRSDLKTRFCRVIDLKQQSQNLWKLGF